MARQWTDDQKKAIEYTGSNILVSAAAGSGKTAVLVERIIRIITDPQRNVDIDRLVVVTFTKAAALEMKQRLREALDDLLCEQPDNNRIIRQITLINNANITTIDSFCLGIIRNHFSQINLDPGFRTADEGEIKLMENDCMEEMLEEYYESENEEFYYLVDAYGTGRDDSNMVDIIYKIYNFARSNPWQDEWYEQALSMYDNENVDENYAVKDLMESVRLSLNDYKAKYEKMIEVINSPAGPSMYLAAVQSDYAGILSFLNEETFSGLSRKVKLFKFETLGRARVKDVDEDKKNFVKQQRDMFKKYMNTVLIGRIFSGDIQKTGEDIKRNKRAVKMMVTLAKDFSLRVQAEKKERGVIDFNDMEHLALDILITNDGNGHKYTKIADSLADYYEEILIDEYQDSNLLQEVILNAVSKRRLKDAHGNIYMVGDVKQSIYRFRLACPWLFIEKYDTYSDEGDNRKIELQKNFRSRENVLNCTNDVFKRVMNKSFSGIEYDDKAKLNAGLDYPVNEEMANFGQKDKKQVEIVLIEKNSKNDDTIRELEAKGIADIINDICGKNGKERLNVYDNKTGSLRPVQLKDIVVLTRSVTGWADTFVNVLMNNDIPAYCDITEGYFNVTEIRTFLGMLTIIDNPVQEIPLASVLLSYFGGFSNEELSFIRVLCRHNKNVKDLYSQIVYIKDNYGRYLNGDTSVEFSGDYDKMLIEKIGHKLEKFINRLDIYRDKSEIMSVYDLSWEIIYDTGYYDYVGTMPAGRKRQANLDLILEKASAFGKTSYTGLFNFLRYIERLQKFEVDFTEASVLGENENLVKVMSIHKSKGLEFPVVILAGIHKKINMSDANGTVLLDQELGIGTDVVDLDKRTKNSTIIKEAISRKLVKESIAEEERVLYVAMTRAREKLYMTGIVDDIDKSVDNWKNKAHELEIADSYTYAESENFKSYMDMVMPVALMDENYNTGSFAVKLNKSDIESDDVTETENAVKISGGNENAEYVTKPGNEEDYRHEALPQLPEYIAEPDANEKVKVTVSELKAKQHDEDMDKDAFMQPEIKKAYEAESLMEEIYIPAFIKGETEKLAGNERGTAYHRVMECLDYHKCDTLEDISENINRMLEENKMTKEQAEAVNAEDIYAFVSSDIGARVKKAVLNNMAYREQPFMFMPDKQLVQGVIDLYFKEDDSFVIVDYKTDKVPKNEKGVEELKKRYSIQLDYYAKALEQITGIPVKEKIIYSFTIGRAITL